MFGSLVLGVLALCAGCGGDAVLRPESSYGIRVISGDQQRGPAGAMLESPLVVLVSDPAGGAAKAVRVRFTVTRGSDRGSRLEDSISVSDAAGRASARLTLGSVNDTTRVEVRLAINDGTAATFFAVAIAAPVVTGVSPMQLRGGDTVTVSGTGFSTVGAVARVGGVSASILAGATATTARFVTPPCLRAGPVGVGIFVGGAPSNVIAATAIASRTPIRLRTYEAVTVAATQIGDCISFAGEAGAAFLVSAQFASGAQDADLMDWRLGAPPSTVTAEAAPGTVASTRNGNSTQRAMERELRQLERRIAGQARADQLERSAAGRALLRWTAAPAIGSLRTFSVVAALDGSKFTTVTARLRFAGEHVRVYTDTGNTVLTDSRLTALASLMDRDLYPVAVNAFGAESDVDADGHVIILLTSVVNSIAKAADCVQRGYVTGFFYGLDVLERVLQSNRSEVFYGFVPDSAGKYSCPHTEDDVVRTLQGTFIHELQHLISFNQHVLARGGSTEDTWLNEGMSHLSEELASRLFEARYPAPLGRGTTTQLFPDSAAPFIAPQLLNAYVYLNATPFHSVTSYSGSGSVEDRGATWLFLRWLADQKGESVFRRLSETGLTGVANIERVSGESFGAAFGDFSLALVADSIPGIARSLVSPRQRFHSRNLRQLMAREAVIAGFKSAFPLATYNLSPTGSLRSSMLPGTMIHALVRTDAAGTPIRIAFTTPGLAPLAVAVSGQVSVMRLPP